MKRHLILGLGAVLYAALAWDGRIGPMVSTVAVAGILGVLVTPSAMRWVGSGCAGWARFMELAAESLKRDWNSGCEHAEHMRVSMQFDSVSTRTFVLEQPGNVWRETSFGGTSEPHQG